jgi:hypothetical protein
MRQATYTYTAYAASYIATSQAGTSGTSLTFAAAALDPKSIAISQVLADGGQSERSIALASTANLSTVLFTVSGLNAWGAPVTFTITGPNNTTVFSTTGRLTTLRSIIPNASFIAASGVTATWGTSGNTNWFVPSTHVPDYNVGIAVVTSGDVTYTLRETVDNLFTFTSNARTFSSKTTSMVGATTSQYANETLPVGGYQVRVLPTTSTSVGSLDATFLQIWH